MGFEKRIANLERRLGVRAKENRPMNPWTLIAPDASPTDEEVKQAKEQFYAREQDNTFFILTRSQDGVVVARSAQDLASEPREL